MTTTPNVPTNSSHRPFRALLPWICALICFLAGAGWLFVTAGQSVEQVSAPPRAPSLATALTPGVVAQMDSPVFQYSDGWRLSPRGADPAEPGDPWAEPSGRLSFVYSGRELALQLAVGDYWSYLFVMVDGIPANRLAVIPGNENSQGQPAGYKPLLAPEQQIATETAEVWVPIHRAEDDGPHTVEVEVWRGWGQTPLRAVAVDALPAAPSPLWPAAAFVLAGVWSLYFGGRRSSTFRKKSNFWGHIRSIRVKAPFFRLHPRLMRFWPVALLTIGAGVVFDSWLLTDAGLALLALAALMRPELWVATLLFGLPFYLFPLPILPGRSLNLIEVGVWGGLVVVGVGWIFFQRRGEKGKRQRGKAKVSASPPPTPYGKKIDVKSVSRAFPLRLCASAGDFLWLCHPMQYAIRHTQSLFLALLLSLALLSAVASQETGVALREWRTVFLAGGGFALLLAGIFGLSDDPARSRRVLINGWLLGGTAVALIALWQFGSGQMIIQAEGVTRVRGLYGSPNNLALYLERTVAVGIGYWILGIGDWGLGRSYSVLRILYFIGRRDHWIRSTQYAILLLPQLAALVLTFSKGALFLGIPALLLVMGVGGAVLLARQGKSLRFLWWLAGIGGIVALGLLPFLGTERFRLLLDFGAETTGGLRLNLWRSAWQMALEHPWLGVGPDNFLYAYRSGYILPAAWQDPNLNHPHNFVLDWWSRLGLPGLLLAALWLGIGTRSLWRQLRTGTNPGLALGCLAAIAAALAHGLIDASYALPDLMIVWVLLLTLPTAQYPQSPRPE